MSVPITVIYFPLSLPARLRYFTDPACAASWAIEPGLRRLRTEFGAEVQITYVMGGLARQYEGDQSRTLREWLDTSSESGMPVDPRGWNTPGAIGSSFPACMAFKAGEEQGSETAERYLRVLREGIMCRRRKLDAVEALVEEARAAGLDGERFRIDLGSNAIVEAFGADLHDTRERGIEALPVLLFSGGDGAEERCEAADGYDAWRRAAIACGAQPAGTPPPTLEDALARFGSLAAVEVAAVCDLPGPRAQAELWRLAVDWRVRPERFLTGELWSLA
jgi:predicted DsbA family dithiol-disulfide isomerase